MTEQEYRNSGIKYLECPICNHIFTGIEKSRNNEISFDIKCYCSNCDKHFFGTDDGVKVNFKPEGLFSQPDYVIEWKQGGDK